LKEGVERKSERERESEIIFSVFFLCYWWRRSSFLFEQKNSVLSQKRSSHFLLGPGASLSYERASGVTGSSRKGRETGGNGGAIIVEINEKSFRLSLLDDGN